MQLNSALYRNSILFFLGFSVLVVWGFWQTYYSNPLQFSDLLIHVHAAAMTLWCVMLIAQAFLIRTNRRDLHRIIGKSSYALAPLNVVLQVAVVRRFTRGFFVEQGVLADGGYTFLSLTLVGALAFSVLFGLAIYYRDRPEIHSRLMVCTALPLLVQPVFRVTRQYLSPIIEYLPSLPGAEDNFVHIVAFALADLALAALMIWDWRSHRRLNVFPAVLVGLVAWQAFTMTGHLIPFWRGFSEWFLAIPGT